MLWKYDLKVILYMNSYRFTRNITEKELKLVINIGTSRNVGEHIWEQHRWVWLEILVIWKSNHKVCIAELVRGTFGCGKHVQVCSTCITSLVAAAILIWTLILSYLCIIHVLELMQLDIQNALTIHQLEQWSRHIKTNLQYSHMYIGLSIVILRTWNLCVVERSRK